MEGKIDSITTSRTDYKATRGDRYDIRRYEDALKMEGDFHSKTTNFESYQKTIGQRADVKKPVDNLKQEGLFYKSPEKLVSSLVHCF